MQDLPLLYLEGGSIIPIGRAIQYVEEAKATDDLTLIIALDEFGKYKTILANLILWFLLLCH